jgi:hypothetical protein
MKFMPPALAFLVGVSVFAQVTPNSVTSKAMPTLAQCRADSDAWATGINPETDSKSLLTADDLMQMVVETSRCGFSVDMQNRNRYLKVEEQIQACISARYFDFLRRHPALWEQFVREDAAGER